MPRIEVFLFPKHRLLAAEQRKVSRDCFQCHTVVHYLPVLISSHTSYLMNSDPLIFFLGQHYREVRLSPQMEMFLVVHSGAVFGIRGHHSSPCYRTLLTCTFFLSCQSPTTQIWSISRGLSLNPLQTNKSNSQ